MDDEKSSMLVMANRDRELLLPVADVPSVDHDIAASSSAAAASSSHHPGRELGLHVPSPEQESGLKWVASESNCTFDDDSIFYKELSSHNFSGPSFVSCGSLAVVGSRQTFYKVVRSWASKKFMTGCVILLPIAITFYITWWFIHFVDGFFSPIYAQLGIDIFGLGFVTSITFIFLVGVFMSSWLGTSVLSLGEWFIKRMPFVRHLYSASKQISAAISPDQNSQAFKEVAIIRHPRIGEYAIGFITSSLVLQNYSGEEELCCVYVPSNHLYIGDIFLVNSRDVIRPNLSVREGIEIVVSGGMSMPQILSTLDPRTVPVDRSRPNRS